MVTADMTMGVIQSVCLDAKNSRKEWHSKRKITSQFIYVSFFSTRSNSLNGCSYKNIICIKKEPQISTINRDNAIKSLGLFIIRGAFFWKNDSSSYISYLYSI